MKGIVICFLTLSIKELTIIGEIGYIFLISYVQWHTSHRNQSCL